MSAKKTTQVKLQASLDRYFPYLMELRRRLLFMVSIFFVGSVFGLIYYEKIITLILTIFNFEGVNIVFTSPFQYITLAINSGLIVGMLAVFPIVVVQLLSFLKPALKRSEYKLTASLIPASIFLTVLGFGYGVFIMRYVVFIFLERSVSFDIGNFLDISRLLSQTMLTSILMAVAFQFPIILTILMRLGVVKPKTLADQRLVAYSVSIIFAALLPPTDLLSLVLLTLPLVILFEFTLLLNKVIVKEKKKGHS